MILDYVLPSFCCEEVQQVVVLDTPSAQGEEGVQLETQRLKVAQHWDILSDANFDSADEDLVINLPPPKRTFYVPVRYVFCGKAKPSVIDFDLD